MEIRTQELRPGLRAEDTLPTVNPRSEREARVVGEVVGMTHRGRVREANEDHFVVADLERSLRLRQTSLPTRGGDVRATDALGTLLAVADGMGGHGNGELAAAVTLDTVLEHVTYAMPWQHARAEEMERELLTGMCAAVEHCQDRLRQVAARKGASASMGTTLTLVLVQWPDAFVAHVGDSRCYLWRDGRLQQVTRDHTLAEQLRQRHGRAAAAQFEHVLVNAIGGDAKPPDVEGHRLRLSTGDRLLLCTDGLSGELPAPTIAGLLGGARSATEACHRLVSGAIEAGGRDNVTAIVAFF